MIHRIALKNFGCIRDRLDINLTASGNVPESEDRLVSPTDDQSRRVPRVIGLYGPNAAGKSTILRALFFLAWFVDNSFRLPPERSIPCSRFNNLANRGEPIELEVEFDGPADLTNALKDRRARYLYQLALGSGKEEPSRVIWERLFRWPQGKPRRIAVFEREQDEITTSARAFALAGYLTPIKKVLRANASLISTLAQLGHEPSEQLRSLAGGVEANTNLFGDILSQREEFVAEKYLADDRLFAELNEEIAKLDLGITKVSIDRPTNERELPRVSFMHRGLDNPLPATNESQGTRHFFRIFPVISSALERGGVALLDEFDSSIHPLLLPEMIRWFYDRQRNPKNAQIWFTCQNPYLLAELSKDEIIFCEKDDEGGTTAFALKDVVGVRRTDNYMKKYLGGAYGAVPHPG